jgi:hypothetical protein
MTPSKIMYYMGQIDASDSHQKLFVQFFHSSKHITLSSPNQFGIVVHDIHGKEYKTDFSFDDMFFILDSDIIESYLVK